MFGFIASLFGVGYKPCNEVADRVVTDCLERPANDVVAAPWVKGGSFNATGRLNAIAAIKGNVFGLAARGEGVSKKFKFYYRRSMTGCWFAEVWGVWTSVFVATAALWLLGFGIVGARESLALFVWGVLVALVFLPRGLLAFGCNAQVASATGSELGGISGLICLAMGVLGFSVAGYGFMGEWDVPGAAGVLRNALVLMANPYVLASIVVMGGMLFLVGAFFWYVSFKIIGARSTANVVGKSLGYGNNAIVNALYENGSLHKAAMNNGHLQVTLGAIIYACVIGAACIPLVVMFF